MTYNHKPPHKCTLSILMETLRGLRALYTPRPLCGRDVLFILVNLFLGSQLSPNARPW